MHDTLIRRLRDVLRRVLGRRHRVAILVDNLDKAWEKDADFPHLSQLLLGLLGVMRPIASDFGRHDGSRERADVSLAVFLRSDIYWHLSRNAREPDKLQAARLDWSDRALLRRVVEERYAAATGAAGEKIWEAYFAPTVRGVSAADWILNMVLPRPRDLLFLSNAAITTAVNHRHTRVEEVDLLEALKSYSSYAVDSILVEGQADVTELEAVIYEFAGAPDRMTHDEVYERVRAARRKASIEGAIRQLRALSFLGLGTVQTGLIYSDDPQEQERVDAIVAARGKYQGDQAVYAVHPAFRTFLGIDL